MFFLLAPDKIRERFGTTALINGATIRLTAMSCGCIGLLKSLPAILPGASPVITCVPAIEDIPRASMCSLYRLAAGHVVVMRVLHQSMDFARHCTLGLTPSSPAPPSPSSGSPASFRSPSPRAASLPPPMLWCAQGSGSAVRALVAGPCPMYLSINERMGGTNEDFEDGQAFRPIGSHARVGWRRCRRAGAILG